MDPLEHEHEGTLLYAQKLLKKERYAAAKTEFEKIVGVFSNTPIAKEIYNNIALCDAEILKQTAKEWIKRGRNNEKRGRIQEALDAFHMAYSFVQEPWLIERITALEQLIRKQSLFDQAQKNEMNCDFKTAATLYARANAEKPDDTLRRQQARCLMESKEYKDAIPIYLSIEHLTLSDKYDLGYAYYHEMQYYNCLKLWDMIACTDPAFLEQKQNAQNCLTRWILNTFYSTNEFSQEIHEASCYLQDTVPSDEIQIVLDYMFLKSIETYWNEKSYKTLLQHLVNQSYMLSNKIFQHPKLIEISAKVSFKCAEASVDYLETFCLYYLTAIYRKRFSLSTEDKKVKAEDIRNVLIGLGNEVVQSHTSNTEEQIKNLCQLWNLEKQIMASLNEIFPKNRIAVTDAICTPRFSWQFGFNEPMIALLEKNKHRIKNYKEYLMTGAYYTSYGKSLYALFLNMPEEAWKHFSHGETKNDFEQFAKNIIIYFYGLFSIQQKKSQTKAFFQAAIELFDLSDEYESAFIDIALKENDPQQMNYFEEVLKHVYKKRPTDKVSIALSRLMGNNAIILYKNDRMKPQAFKNILLQSLELDENNEMARVALMDFEINQELEEMEKAFRRHKLERFCQIALQTNHDEVYQAFWEGIDSSIQALDIIEPESRLSLYHDIRECIMTVDSDDSSLEQLDAIAKKAGLK